MTEVVVFEELATASGHRVGVATLNTPAALNALSLTTVRALAPMFHRWAADDAIVAVLLQAAGDKAFCAGADLRELYDSLRASGGEPGAYPRAFFSEEYVLDHAIHTYAKPIVCWGHGIVMGGGVGLMAGASHRVVTPQTRFAMPEINIGLFPDVAGSWLLERMPGRVGLFLALTGAAIDMSDAIFCGAADVAIADDRRAEVVSAICATHWTGAPRADRAAMSRLLAERSLGDLAPSNVRQRFDLVNALMAGGDLLAIAARLRDLRSDDAWLTKAVAGFLRGSPTTAALAFELRHRVRHRSLADVFRLEYDVALGCCAHTDFAEGIRALLIDKDRNPCWSPASLEDVSQAHIDDHFRVRYTGTHPLATL